MDDARSEYERVAPGLATAPQRRFAPKVPAGTPFVVSASDKPLRVRVWVGVAGTGPHPCDLDLIVKPFESHSLEVFPQRYVTVEGA